MTQKELIIIGGGPAGLSAAIYSSRAGIDTEVLEKAVPGGQLWLSSAIENYPGSAEPRSSYELAASFEKHALVCGASIRTAGVNAVSRTADGKLSVQVTGEEDYTADSIIIATGASMKSLGIPGEKEYTGRGVSYCAVCDGPLYKGKSVAVLGGGNTALEEAHYLTRYASKVYLIHRRDRFRAIDAAVRKVSGHPKIEFRLSNNVTKISGGDTVGNVELSSGEVLEVAGVFIFAGLHPATEFAEGFIDMKDGFIVTDRKLMTSEEGVFAAGDCRHDAFRQVITACADGALAAEEARKYIEKIKGKEYDK